MPLTSRARTYDEPIRDVGIRVLFLGERDNRPCATRSGRGSYNRQRRMSTSVEPVDPHVELTLEVESADGYLHAIFSGPVSRGRAFDLYKEMCAEAVARGFQKVLMDWSAVTGELSNRERYTFATDGVQYQRQNQMSLKIALLGKEPIVTGLGVAVSQNRGRNVEFFSDYQRAVAWLNKPRST